MNNIQMIGKNFTHSSTLKDIFSTHAKKKIALCIISVYPGLLHTRCGGHFFTFFRFGAMLPIYVSVRLDVQDMSKNPEISGRLDVTCKRPGILGCFDIRLNVLGHVDISQTSKRMPTYTLINYFQCTEQNKVILLHELHCQRMHAQIYLKFCKMLQISVRPNMCYIF